jgi:hypothetical protein
LNTPARPLPSSTPARAATTSSGGDDGKDEVPATPGGTSLPIPLEGIVKGEIKVEGMGTLYSMTPTGEAVRKAARVKAALVANDESDDFECNPSHQLTHLPLCCDVDIW